MKLLVSKNTCLVEKDGGGNTGADAPIPVFKPPPVTNVIEIFTVVGFDFFTIASAFISGQPSLMLADEARSLPLSKKTKLARNEG